MSRAKLSVNINKYALLRNSRGGLAPDLLDAADICLRAGAHGITVHPRRDQRHIRFDDVPRIAVHLAENWPDIEFNIECEDAPEIIDLVLELRPAQCTLVPVTPGEVTSDHGWSLPQQSARLKPTIARLKAAGIRTSCFADCDPTAMGRFADAGTDRVELYTGPYAWAWGTNDADRQRALVWDSAVAAERQGMGVNAGHDLDHHNLAGLLDLTPLAEVSIGHAQICRALQVGTAQSVSELLTALGW